MELNNIYNVDSYEAIKQLPDNSIDCIYTDIPYLIVHGGGGNSALSQRIDKKCDDFSEIKDGINYDILDEFVRVMKKVNIFIWCSKLQILDLMEYFKNYNFEILVWCKTNPQPATRNTWLPDIEYCLYFRENGVKLNDGYEFKSKWYESPINKNDKDLYDHPTIKPLELVKRHLLHTTQENDVVLDPFVGSGTTAVAAKELGRNYIGFDISDNYCKIAIDRLNGVSVQERKLKDAGVTDIFDFLGE